MRAFFSNISIAAVLVFSFVASAAVIEKPDSSTAINAICISDLKPIVDQLSLVKTELDTFTSAVGYVGLTSIHEKTLELESRMVKATTDCNAIVGALNSQESSHVFYNFFEVIFPIAKDALSSVYTKKAEFDAISNANTIVKNDIKSLETKTEALKVALTSKLNVNAMSTAYYIAMIDYRLKEIYDYFNRVKNSYGI